MILTYKNIFYEKNGPSLLDFEGKIYQIARLLQWVPIGNQNYKKIIGFSSFVSCLKPNLAEGFYGWLQVQLHDIIEKKTWIGPLIS